MRIEPSTLEFLADLAVNNNRDWFLANKKRFEAAQDNVTAFAGNMIGEIGKFDDAVATLDPRSCVFRIYRDVRFSKDKSPYKTNLSIYISPGGRKSMLPGYYFHVQPGHSFIAGGKHVPAGPELLKIRTTIADNSLEFLEIVNRKSFVERFGELRGDRLKSFPKGFDQGNKASEYLKLKEFMAYLEIADDRAVASDDFPKKLVKIIKEMFPLVAFLRRALGI